MKYTLILGIEYKRYKDPAVVTVSIGDKFVDTFQLEKDSAKIDQSISNIEHRWFNEFDKKNRLSRSINSKKIRENVPSFFKIYQINDADIEGDLKVKVDNDNTDFTNGFMKNNSVLSLSIVALFPSVLCNNKGEKLIKTCIKLSDGYHKFRARHSGQSGIDELRPDPTWPVAESFYVRRKDEVYEKSEIKDETWTIGGSFKAEFPIGKKHKVKYLRPLRYKKTGFVFTMDPRALFISSCKSLLNIYDEDQRSNSTQD